jgi:dolichol-phosphate mannosyltransferase
MVLPTYNEEANIALMVEQVVPLCTKLASDYQIIFVDDGSEDDTALEIKKAADKNDKIKFISFTRNFGHDTAIRAGIDYADGDLVIVMDADLQHPIETAEQMIDLWRKGFDVVHGVRSRSKKLTDFFAVWFYKFFNLISNMQLYENATDFILLDKKVYQFVREISEAAFFFRGLVTWVGLKQTTVPFACPPRVHGTTKYSFTKLINLSLDAITSFSIYPLRIFSRVGFLIMVFSFCYALIAIGRRLFFETPFGFTAIFVAILFLGGLNVFALGVIGEYIGKILLETKSRPKYLIKEKKV